MNKYYAESLSAKRLEQCYKLANERIKQYLLEEILYTQTHISSGDSVLELGCGYGRILKELHCNSKYLFGIDNSIANLQYGKQNLKGISNCFLALMDAKTLGFPSGSFNLTLVLQNGISAFHVEQKTLVQETIRVTRPGGKVLFSTYSAKFWDDRLQWFETQSDAGLIGDIDYDKTGNGTIICKDGFKATTISPDQFRSLVSGIDRIDSLEINEIDGSSVFFKILVA